ncbi:MAG: heme-dependent oxidative N-demethylase family protein, partial [Rhodobacterales bacterium]
ARPAAEELLDEVLEDLSQRDDFTVTRPLVRRPDGVCVEIDRGDPLGVLGRLVQEDLCLLEKIGDEHVLTGAILCFPASWTLAEKFMRPLVAIHEPVDSYDDNIAKRVQRLFDGVKPERPLWRYNLLRYVDPTLHQPRPEMAPRAHLDGQDFRYIRSERQCVLRLPKTDAVVFSIHTYVLKDSDVHL